MPGYYQCSMTMTHFHRQEDVDADLRRHDGSIHRSCSRRGNISQYIATKTQAIPHFRDHPRDAT